MGRIDLPFCFGTAANFRKEILTFKVVGFQGTYHAIIGASRVRLVHGDPQLHQPKTEDAQAQGSYHRQLLLRARIRMRRRVRRIRGSSRQLCRARLEARGHQR